MSSNQQIQQNKNIVPTSLKNENNKILSIIPESSLITVETQNNELNSISNSIIGIFGSIQEFYKYGALYLTEEGDIVIGINKEDSKVKNLKDSVKLIANQNKMEKDKLYHE